VLLASSLRKSEGITAIFIRLSSYAEISQYYIVLDHVLHVRNRKLDKLVLRVDKVNSDYFRRILYDFKNAQLG